jgi:hypothetical protein
MLAFWRRWTANQATLAAEQVRLAAEHARKAGEIGLRSRALGWYVATLMYGPRDAETIARELDAIEQEEPGPYLAAFANLGRGEVARLHGQFDEARHLTDQALRGFHALGTHTMTATCEQFRAWIELSASDGAAAVAALMRADTILAELGERSLRSTIQALLARAFEMEHDAGAAQAAIDLAEELSAPQEAANYAVTHEVRARLALAGEDFAAAEQWARSAVKYALETDFVALQAWATFGLARVLAALSRTGEATSEGRMAQGLFDAKGDRPGASVARTLLEGLSA